MKGVVRPTKRPPRIVLYGPPKIGKSSFGADAPAPIFVTTEDGVDAVPVDQFPMCTSWTDILARVKQVAQDEHKYETLVIDTLNGLAELCAQHVCKTMFKNDYGPAGFNNWGKGQAATSEEIRLILPLLDKCRHRGMTIILLAHDGTQSVQDPIGGDFKKFAPNLEKKVWARFSAWADIILRATYNYSVVERDGKTKAIGGSTRILKASGSASEDAGVRVGYDLPEQLDLSWGSVADALGKPNGVVESITELWPLLNAEDSCKGLAYLGVERLEDIGEAQLSRARVVQNRLVQKSHQQKQQQQQKEG